MVVLRLVDNNCINIGCKVEGGRPLTEYELIRQKKSRKYRFCKKCRMLRYTNNVRWKCVSCGKVIEIGSYVGQYYCSIRGCFTLNNERARDNRERMKTKHRIKSFIKKIEWDSNTEKYKVKNDSFKVGRPKGSRDLKPRKIRTDY